MLKELKYLLHLLTIFIFFFILIKFYLSDSYEKKLYRSLNNYDEVIKKYSKNLNKIYFDSKNIQFLNLIKKSLNRTEGNCLMPEFQKFDIVQ